MVRIVAALVAASGCLSAQTTPAPDALIARAIVARKAQADRGTKYTFQEEQAQSQIDKNGIAGPPSSRTYEHIMLEGAEYKKLILTDGKPLDVRTQKKVDDDLAKEAKDRTRHRLLSINRRVSLGGLDLYTKLFDNKVTGEETVLGRKAWRMESEPKADAKPANSQEKEAVASRRVTWFDQEEGAPIREINVFIRAANGFQPGSKIDLQYRKVGDDWLPDNFSMWADLKMMAVIHGRVDSHQRYYDYKRFSVNSSIKPE